MSISSNNSDSSYNSDTRISLIQQAQADEPSAWVLVHTIYAPLIRRWARSNGVSCQHELENVCQDVFAKLVRKLDTYEQRENGGSFRGWLRAITRNHVLTHLMGDAKLKTVGGSDWLRKQQQIPFGKEMNSLLSSVSDENPDEKSIIFRKIVAWVDSNYKKRDRVVFRRVIIEERSVREVAKDLNVTTNVIYQIKSRMLAKIREVFKDMI